MISVFAGIPRFSGSLAVKGCLAGFLAVSASGLWAQQDHLTDAVSRETSSGTPIGNGLVLPSVGGRVWARDNFDGGQKLVQLKYLPTELDRRTFIYKAKVFVEIQGAAANVRLCDPNVSIYMRGFDMTGEDAAPSHETSVQTDLTLVKVESKNDRRLLSTVTMQLTGKASRSDQTVDISIERLGNTDWYKVTPKAPLEPGEYALMFMPRGQDLLPITVFDFAIDTKESGNAIMQSTATSPKKQSPGE